MKTQTTLSSDLIYQKEHLNCDNYVTNERAILEIIEIKAGKRLVREDLGRTSLAFVLSGNVDVSTGGAVCQRVNAEQMFLIAAGDNFYGWAFTDTRILRCTVTKEMTLCNQFSITQLQKYIRPEKTIRGG